MIVAVLKKFQKLWEILNDWILNIDTKSLSNEANWNEASGLSLAMLNRDAHGYQTVDYLNLRKIRRLLQLEQGDTVYDLGCGKGRVLCVFAQTRAQRCVGIEIVPDFCEVARRNAKRLRGRRSPIEIRCQDVASANLSDGTVYFMFNPFGSETMRNVLEHIYKSLATKPRKVRIIYLNPREESSIASCQWLQKIAEYRTLGGMCVVLYQSVS